MFYLPPTPTFPPPKSNLVYFIVYDLIAGSSFGEGDTSSLDIFNVLFLLVWGQHVNAELAYDLYLVFMMLSWKDIHLGFGNIILDWSADPFFSRKWGRGRSISVEVDFVMFGPPELVTSEIIGTYNMRRSRERCAFASFTRESEFVFYNALCQWKISAFNRTSGRCWARVRNKREKY